jgi:RNA polymerase sigma factor (sigma-70 family)
MRCEAEIRFHARSVANLSQLSANVEERADDLLQSFYEKFVSILPMYSPETSRLTTYFKRPARNFFINCLKAEEVERRNGTKLRKVMKEESHDHQPPSWFSADDPEKQAWIVKAIDQLVSTNELTELQVNVFRLRVIDGKRIVDVAKECGCSNGFVSENARFVESRLRELAAKQVSDGGYYV